MLIILPRGRNQFDRTRCAEHTRKQTHIIFCLLSSTATLSTGIFAFDPFFRIYANGKITQQQAIPTLLPNENKLMELIQSNLQDIWDGLQVHCCPCPCAFTGWWHIAGSIFYHFVNTKPVGLECCLWALQKKTKWEFNSRRPSTSCKCWFYVIKSVSCCYIVYDK